LNRVTVFLFLLLVAVPFTAQSDTLPLTDEVGGLELISNEPSPGPTHHVKITSDGSRMAWWRGADVCVRNFVDETDTCVDVPDFGEVLNLRLFWANDDRTLVLNRHPEYRLLNTDTGRYLPPPSEDTAPGIWFGDIAQNGTRYFLANESYIDESGFRQTVSRALYRQAPDATDPELVFDLTPAIEEYFWSFSLVGLSPDETKLALTSGVMQADTPGTLWTFDLTTETLTPISTTFEIMQAGMPEWMIDEGWAAGAQLVGLDWTADSSGVVVVVDNGAFQIRGSLPATYRIDVETGTVIPWMDYATVPDYQTFASVDPRDLPGFPTFFDRHDNPVYVQEHGILIYENRPSTFSGVGISAISGPGEPPLRLHLEIDTNSQYQGQLGVSSYGTNGEIVRVLIADRLLTFRVT
jgi:hypothetical protein